MSRSSVKSHLRNNVTGPRAADLLGYPSDARLLILNADDFGMCHAANEGIVRTLKTGPVSSCILMVPCPWSLHALNLLRASPELPFGVHLTVVSEQPDYRWGPLTCRSEVPSLVDEAGYFYSEGRSDEVLDRADGGELEREYRAQIEAVLASGLKPTHLDSHCGSHTRRERVFDMTARLALEYGLALRVYGETYIKKLQAQGLPTLDHELMDSYTLDVTGKDALYTQMLRDLPAGLSEWAVHPGLDTPEMQAAEPGSRVRQTDFAFFSSARAQEVIAEAGITVLSYRDLQRVWQEKR